MLKQQRAQAQVAELRSEMKVRCAIDDLEARLAKLKRRNGLRLRANAAERIRAAR